MKKIFVFLIFFGNSILWSNGTQELKKTTEDCIKKCKRKYDCSKNFGNNQQEKEGCKNNYCDCIGKCPGVPQCAQ